MIPLNAKNSINYSSPSASLSRRYQPREECGVFGVFQRTPPAAADEATGAAGHCKGEKNRRETAAEMAALGLQALQHRGQEACGIVCFTGQDSRGMEENPTNKRGLGMVSHLFRDASIMRQLNGHIAIGHTRYATRGQKGDINAVQPFIRLTPVGRFALAHNGQFTNSQAIRRHLQQDNRAFDSQSDTMALVEAIAASPHPELIARIKHGVMSMRGAFALVIATPKQLIGVRDPHGIRPLILGRIPQCGSHVLASESCALDIVGAKIVRDVAPGEMIIIDAQGIHDERLSTKVTRPRTCIFEYVYFSRPDSIVDGIAVYEARINMGQQLAQQELQKLGLDPAQEPSYRDKLDGDIVISVPDSGNPAAMGFAKGLGINYEMGIIRNHYTGRSFIEPDSKGRISKVRIKHNPNSRVLDGKRVYVVDDSIVRGHTSISIVKMLRSAGAKEVHLRISCPQVLYNCCYGIDIPDRASLLAVEHKGDIDKIAQILGVDSLMYLSIDGIYRALGEEKRHDVVPQFTDHYFTGDYPIIPDAQEMAYFSQPVLPLDSSLSQGFGGSDMAMQHLVTQEKPDV